MNKVSDFFIRANWLIRPLMDSPFHWLLSSRLVLLRFRGRKSGKEFVTPVAYTKFDDWILICLTETRGRKWWRNYTTPWPMELKYRGAWRSGYAVVVAPGSDEYRQWYERIFNRDGFMAKIMKIHDYDRKAGLTAAQLDILLQATTGLVKFAASEEQLRKG